MAVEGGGGCSAEDRSPRDDIEPTCDMTANPVSGFACYFDRFRRASIQVCPPPFTWFILCSFHPHPQPLPSPSLFCNELTRSLPSIPGAQGLSQAYRL